MTSRLDHGRLLPRVENDERFVLDVTGEHLAVRAPSDRCHIVRHIRESNHCIITPVLIDVPNLDSFVNRVRSKKIFCGCMPLDTDTFTRVRFKLKITVRAMLCQSLVVIEDPELGLAVVGTSAEQAILEGRPLDVENVAAVSLEQRDVRIEGSRTICIEDCDRRGTGPWHGDHFTVGGDAIVLVCIAGQHAIECDQWVKSQVLESLCDTFFCHLMFFVFIYLLQR